MSRAHRALAGALLTLGWLGARGLASASLPPLRDLGPAPEIAGIRGWINSAPLSLKQLHGKVVLVKFWTFACINCQRTLPATAKWYERYHDQGFEIVSVHTPELEQERDPRNVERAVRDAEIHYPVALDVSAATWRAYHNEYWPAWYLVDARGRIRYTHIGEGAYEETDRAIAALLAEAKAGK